MNMSPPPVIESGYATDQLSNTNVSPISCRATPLAGTVNCTGVIEDKKLGGAYCSYCMLNSKIQYVASVGSGYQHQKGAKVLLTT